MSNYSFHGLCCKNKLLYKRCAFSTGRREISTLRSSQLKTIRHILDINDTQNLVKLDQLGVTGQTPEFWPNIQGYPFYPRDAMLARVFATASCLSVCLSVRLSVTRRYCD